MDLASLLERLKNFDAVGAVEGTGLDTVVRVGLPGLRPLLAALKQAGFNMLVDVTAVDRMKLPDHDPRFEVTYRLMALNLDTGLIDARLAVQARVADGEPIPHTAMDLWPSADWTEREVWDMFGIPFADRPDIKRLLMYPEFKGHALRKDYPIHKRQPLIGPKSGDRDNNPSFNAEVPTVTVD